MGKPRYAIHCISVRNGHIKRITDEELQFPVFEILGMNVSANFIALPMKEKESLDISLPIIILLAKNVLRR